jgi:ATP-dependent helicase/nuclease subunit B
VVLPGLDQGLDDDAWQTVGGVEPSAAGHPQYGLKLLLESFGVRRDAVASLGTAPLALESRDRFVSEAMRPAETTERWVGAAALPQEAKRAAVGRIGIVEAANEREEALAVAVLLREAAETKDAVAALVTSDRALARRVAVELRRWGIDVDDSAGRPLGRTPPGIFARLVAETALSGTEAETLLALLKHPLAAFGGDPDDAHDAARSLERAALRGPRLKPGLAALRHALALRRATKFGTAEDGDSVDRTYAAKFLTKHEWQAADDLAACVGIALVPLEVLAAGDGAVALETLVAAHLEALQAAAGDAKRRTALFADEAGEALALAFEELQASAVAGPRILPQEYPALFAALIERIAVRRRGGVDPRIHIWGALEARLQSVDRVVLGGLNEGTWPAQTRLDPLLSRPMRTALSLEPPERRIGLAAHDFSQALGHAEVWLTRADREDGEPKVASRWLQRLAAHAGSDLAEEMRKRGRRYLAYARRLDRPAKVDPPRRPAPSPPVALRPKRLSATRIETLIRDPYAIYAQYVLDLRPFEPLAKLPDARERGTLVHDILERFIAERPQGPFDAAALARLLEIGREAFDANADFPEIVALWWPRFEKIARWLVATEASRGDVAERNVEATGEMVLTPDFKLTARADRIDRLVDGTLSIIDYKTGTPPSIDEVLSLSPQLPLEALIALKGGFAGIEAAPPSRLEYFQLSGRGEGGVVWDRSGREARRGKDAVSLPQALAAAGERLQALVATFAEEHAKYLSRKIPKRGRVFVGDYDHLARVAEWTTTEEEDDQGIPQP